jgi:hypothetical protein
VAGRAPRSAARAALNEITTNYRLGKWEPSELNGGKLCEIVYTILRRHVDGKFPARPSKPGNMVDACNDLAEADKKIFPQSVRITIPRVLIALYEIRNNRGVGHVGGDVDPNHMDATLGSLDGMLGLLIPVMIGLAAIAVLTFFFAFFSSLGLWVPTDMWRPLVLIGVACFVALLVLHPSVYAALPLALNLGLAWVAWTSAWTPAAA